MDKLLTAIEYYLQFGIAFSSVLIIFAAIQKLSEPTQSRRIEPQYKMTIKEFMAN